MAPKPRVHEVASEMGVDSKVALATLKRMGEYVKGPSSSIELAVARKLRTALAEMDAPRSEWIELGRRRDEAMALLRRLPRALPEFAELLAAVSAGRLPSRELLRTAVASRILFFAPSAAEAEIERLAASTEGLRVVDVPAPSGVAVVCGATRPLPPRTLLWWEVRNGTLEIASAEFDYYTGTGRDRDLRFRFGPTTQRSVTESSGRFPTAGSAPVALLAGLCAAVPTTPRRGADNRAVARRETPAAGGTGTQIIYLNRASDGDTHESAADAVRRQSQWTVRGHWRNQWYASEKDHHRIWIDEHTAGNSDAPLVTRPKVYVIRPRPAG